MGNELKTVIRERGMLYKQVAYQVGCSLGSVCADIARERVSAEKAMCYGRALNVDPSLFRPDIFKPGEVTFNVAK